MTGVELLLALRRLDPDQLRRPAEELVDELVAPRCDDCDQPHDSVWAAVACDQLSGARARREAAHQIRTARLRPRRPWEDRPWDWDEPSSETPMAL